MFDNIQSVKELYKEILIKYPSWHRSWDDYKIDEDDNCIIIKYELHQGAHHVYGSPIVFWKHTSYPVAPKPPRRKLHEILGSIYAKIKEW